MCSKYSEERTAFIISLSFLGEWMTPNQPTNQPINQPKNKQTNNKQKNKELSFKIFEKRELTSLVTQ